MNSETHRGWRGPGTVSLDTKGQLWSARIAHWLRKALVSIYWCIIKDNTGTYPEEKDSQCREWVGRSFMPCSLPCQHLHVFLDLKVYKSCHLQGFVQVLLLRYKRLNQWPVAINSISATLQRGPESSNPITMRSPLPSTSPLLRPPTPPPHKPRDCWKGNIFTCNHSRHSKAFKAKTWVED